MSANHSIVASCCNLSVAAYYQHGLLLQCHGLQDLIHIVCLQFLRIHGTHTPYEYRTDGQNRFFHDDWFYWFL